MVIFRELGRNEIEDLWSIDRREMIDVLDNKFIGKAKDQLKLKFLHVSRDYRKQGLGRQLFYLAWDTARERGAKRLYISATPSENTVNFYLSLGAVVTNEPDPSSTIRNLKISTSYVTCNLYRSME